MKDTRIRGAPEKGAKSQPRKAEIFGEGNKMSKAANSLYAFELQTNSLLHSFLKFLLFEVLGYINLE